MYKRIEIQNGNYKGIFEISETIPRFQEYQATGTEPKTEILNLGSYVIIYVISRTCRTIREGDML